MKEELIKKLKDNDITCNILLYIELDADNSIHEKGDVWFSYTFTEKTTPEDKIGMYLGENEYDEIVENSEDGINEAYNCILTRYNQVQGENT